MSGNLKVVVRCRPLNSREIGRGAVGLIRMEGNNTFIDPPSDSTHGKDARATEKKTMSFAFDKSYWSACGKDEPGYASQETVYNDLGKDLLDHAFEGFNTCIIAYGQTGSGKSYSMMGYGADRGIIPLICEALFQRITAESTDKLTFNVEVSYTEIYQEKVRDLLNPANKGNLKVREHPTLGPYVEGLAKLAVQNFADIEQLMDEGTKARTVAATNMNETSSRSHAVFTLLLTQKRTDETVNLAGEKVSRISLVDLAGSERANATGATGTRLKEGALINKSLTTLGRVISALAVASSATGKNAKAAAEKVPYRDSVLTWLLKDSLGGNSKTAMIAAISPADYEETLSTLRYADQAKKIKNKAVVNEDPNAKLIRELKEELMTLRTRITGAGQEAHYDPDTPPEKQVVQYKTKEGEIKTITKADLQEQLQDAEMLMASVTETWESKLEKTKEIQKEREQALEALGITIEKNSVGVHTPKKMPHLVNLNEDPLMSECLIYQIKPGKTVVGNATSDLHADIRLSGASILPVHCSFQCSAEGKVTLHPEPNSLTMVNGQRIPSAKPRELLSGYRIILGDFHVFRFNHPEEVRKAREVAGPSALRSPLVDDFVEREGAGSPGAGRADSPLSTAENADWSYARREAVVARLNGADVNLDQLKDSELNDLYANIIKVKQGRTGGTSVASGDRPESRMSFMDSLHEDDDEEEIGTSSPASRRPISSSTWSTNPTSIEDATLTLTGTPELEDRVLAVKEEYETRLSTMVDTADVQFEQHAMATKLQALEKQIKQQKQRYERRLRKSSPSGDHAGLGDEEDLLDVRPMTPAEQVLARKAVKAWRGRRRVAMAEDGFAQAVAIKEANVVSRELKKGVTFQFVVVEHDVPVSGSEAIGGLADIDDVSDPALIAASKPCVAVKVLDRKNSAVYIWSLPKLHHRLGQMRNLLKFVDKPEYSQHFSWEDPFYEAPPLPGGFSWVGEAGVSLAPLARNLPSTSEVGVWSPYTADPVGRCRIRLRVVAIEMPQPDGDDLGQTVRRRVESAFVDGAKVTVEVEVDRVAGLNSAEFSAVHLQLSLSGLFGLSPAEDHVFTSELIDLRNSPLADLHLGQTVSFTYTPALDVHLRTAHARVDFFARTRHAHLDKIERWDEARDASATSRALADPLRGDPRADVTRRPETELVGEQRHDVMAGLEVLELGEKGEYEAVQVVKASTLDGGAFFLRQGLQRRVVLRLSHSSGKAWAWRRISKVQLGEVRMLDGKGMVHAGPTQGPKFVELKPNQPAKALFEADGTARLSFTSSWDSSAHDSVFLNTNTPSGQRALLRLSFVVEADNLAQPVPFSMDLAVTVSPRDARAPNRLLSLLTQQRKVTRLSNLFAVALRPWAKNKGNEVWRLNTADRFVRGEEVLAGWRPRVATGLVRDWARVRGERRREAEVQAARAVLEAFELTLPPPVEVERDARLRRVISLWTRHQDLAGEVPLERPAPTPAPSTPGLLSLESHPGSGASTPPTPSLLVSPPPPSGPTLFIGEAAIVPKTDAAAMRGPLALLRDPSSQAWTKLHCVLQRPYLHCLDGPEGELVLVVNLEAVRVEQSADLERMVGRRWTFGVFTHQNSYFFQAPSARGVGEWIRAVDPGLA